jgi:hypothetical protein
MANNKILLAIFRPKILDGHGETQSVQAVVTDLLALRNRTII